VGAEPSAILFPLIIMPVAKDPSKTGRVSKPGPVAPVGPVSPVGPVGPVGPVAPVAPVGKVTTPPLIVNVLMLPDALIDMGPDAKSLIIMLFEEPL
jgi:hypothetical protein